MSLNPRQQRFVAEYLTDLNATQAAIRAGYNPKNADVTGPRLLGNVGISAEVQKRQALLAEKHGITVDRIVCELAKIGFANMKDYMGIGVDGLPRLDWANLSRDQAAALSEVTVEQVGLVEHQDPDDEERSVTAAPVRKVKFKLADKRASLVDLGKHLGMFTEKVNLTVTGNLADRLEDLRKRRARR